LSDDEATGTLLANLSGETITEPRHKNCIAIGLSSGFLEPLESTSIHLVTTAILRLMKLFPFGGNTTMLAEQFNRETQLELETVRDFALSPDPT
jgi:tryptophan halogenase